MNGSKEREFINNEHETFDDLHIEAAIAYLRAGHLEPMADAIEEAMR